MKKIIALASLSLLLFAVSTALAADGAEVYKTACAGCHGADGDKSAGGSSPLKGQKADEALKKLQGYADGTYGGKQKKIMENIAKKHNADELKALSDHIGTL